MPQPVKRFEILVESLHVPRVVRLLDRAGVLSYAVIRDVSGKGDHGERRGDELTDVQRTSCIIAACPLDRETDLTTKLRPLLVEYGGSMMVSDGKWFKGGE